MGCISNITGAITYDCLGGAVGIADLLLINYSDIQSISIAAGVAMVTLRARGRLSELPLSGRVRTRQRNRESTKMLRTLWRSR